MTREDVKRLAHGFFGRPDIPEFETPFNGKVLPLVSMTAALLELPASVLGLYAWLGDPLERKFSITQKYEYIAKAMECGREEAKNIMAEYQTSDPEELASLWGLVIRELERPAGGGNVIFAQFAEPDEVIIFMDAVEKAEIVMREEELGSLLEYMDVRKLLLAHEIFHAVEFWKSESIYTKTEKVELWKKPFSNQSRLICLSEIAGMAFAGELLDLSFSPYVFDVILMYGYNKEAATAIYEEIMSLAAVTE